ncbi:bestrophin family protein [Pseudomonas chlororaphis]|uniref:bestrophin family protein n=1 Tax=Pseudomonas chlororaphis TaxID=587753 RepID=UPI0006A5F6B3|nr:bestrophin family protein [Pseudomonas chlororaphis]AZC32002.1 putative membrane protein [Pseudomonas chlororaphis subsp. piscium]WDG77396.1 bestrophin family protein [Pseudomonas chlororaphis]WDG83365.1 bestrophin family protein [Pseudomonas chlororaphis]WDG89746.1 bestrophin family protein [Pseudomonas chlororaphis]SDS76563.1 putative membrane protein [Pseudomonas chlororaphis]
MIVRSKPNLINVLISLKGSIAKRIALRSLLVTLLASVIVFIETLYPAYFSRVNATPFTLLGLSLSIFMSFRNNACYDRWYEARKALGTLVTEVRSMIRETQVIKDPRQRGKILRDLCGFAHALNARLRQEDESSAAGTWLSQLPSAQAPNVPDSILRHVGQQCSALAESGAINEWRYTLLANHLSSLTNAQTICERIKGTPLPFPYTLLLHRTSYIFCILLPFAMAEPLGWLTPIFTAIVSYTFFGLDAIGDELEDPFGRDENDLPTNALVRTIEREVLDALGATQLPPVLQPVDFVLS